MDENSPIDIHYNKLLDWLIDRRHCDSKWHAQSKEVRSRVTKAIPELPKSNSEIFKILEDAGEGLNYFDCKKILEEVKKEDGVSTTLFGHYSALRVKEWSEIVKAYEQRKVFLADCGQQLVRLVNYEVPALKQQLGRCQQVIRDCHRREGEFKVHAAALMESYRSACANMGIKGANVAEELRQLTSSLPEVFRKLLECLPSLQPAIDYYRSFLNATRKANPPSEDLFLPMLTFVLESGNVMVYQWKHGKVCPLSHQPEDNLQLLDLDLGVSELDIDWGEDAGLGGTGDGAEIDFGRIDFGEEGDGGVVDLEMHLEECGITVETAGIGNKEGNEGGEDVEEEREEVEERQADGGTADPAVEEGDTELLLENKATKNLFLDDIYELQEFLARRKVETASEGMSLIQMGTLDEFAAVECGLNDMLGHVTEVLDHLTNQKVQHLLLIKGSSRYLQRLVEKLTQDLKLSQKASQQLLETECKREQTSASLKLLQPRYSSLVVRTKALQAQTSSEISQLYRGRRVNIMGEINQIT